VAEAFNSAVAKAKVLNAFIVETPEHALAAADQADRDRSDGLHKPLSGVPIGMKDLFATKGFQTTAASGILDGFKPVYESTVSDRLFTAGAGMLGKLNLDQFAMDRRTRPAHTGTSSRHGDARTAAMRR
jgi:aspartyl-tRNA(Asn)/glutamyl-tRNA(Gln) amidotransferase subunit A